LQIHAASEADAARVAPRLLEAYTLADQPTPPPPLILEVLE
jgi:hypothetical protein